MPWRALSCCLARSYRASSAAGVAMGAERHTCQLEGGTVASGDGMAAAEWRRRIGRAAAERLVAAAAVSAA